MDKAMRGTDAHFVTNDQCSNYSIRLANTIDCSTVTYRISREATESQSTIFEKDFNLLAGNGHNRAHLMGVNSIIQKKIKTFGLYFQPEASAFFHRTSGL